MLAWPLLAWPLLAWSLFAWIGQPSWGFPWPELQWIALAGGLGAILGLERELAGKPAGLRTHILVGAGACLLMLLGDLIVAQFASLHPGGLLSADPLRIVQAIVVGISFLGAGTIIHQGGEYVEGLTTAASILLTAGIGMAVAIGQMGLAIGATLFVAVVLYVVGWMETLIRMLRRHWRDKRSQEP